MYDNEDREPEVIMEVHMFSDRPYVVEVQENGWRWREDSRWIKKSSALYHAETLANGYGQPYTRVVKVR